MTVTVFFPVYQEHALCACWLWDRRLPLTAIGIESKFEGVCYSPYFDELGYTSDHRWVYERKVELRSEQ